MCADQFEISIAFCMSTRGLSSADQHQSFQADNVCFYFVTGCRSLLPPAVRRLSRYNPSSQEICKRRTWCRPGRRNSSLLARDWLQYRTWGFESEMIRSVCWPRAPERAEAKKEDHAAGFRPPRQVRWLHQRRSANGPFPFGTVLEAGEVAA